MYCVRTLHRRIKKHVFQTTQGTLQENMRHEHAPPYFSYFDKYLKVEQLPKALGGSSNHFEYKGLPYFLRFQNGEQNYVSYKFDVQRPCEIC